MRFLSLCLVLILSASSPAFAEGEDGRDPHIARIAVLDVNVLLRDSKAAKHIQEQMKDKRDAYQKQINRLEKSLQKMEAELVDLHKKEDAEGFAEQKKEYEAEMTDTRKKVAELRASLDSAYDKGMSELRSEILEIVADISDKAAYDLVISRQEVVIVSAEMDITETVMDHLNEQKSKIKLSFK